MGPCEVNPATEMRCGTMCAAGMQPGAPTWSRLTAFANLVHRLLTARPRLSRIEPGYRLVRTLTHSQAKAWTPCGKNSPARRQRSQVLFAVVQSFFQRRDHLALYR